MYHIIHTHPDRRLNGRKIMGGFRTVEGAAEWAHGYAGGACVKAENLAVASTEQGLIVCYDIYRPLRLAPGY